MAAVDGALGLWTLVPGFAAVPGAGIAWLAALVGTALLARRLAPRPGSRWLADEQRLLLPGSWVPLVLIVAIFTLRYAMGVADVLNPALRDAPSLLLPAALLFGALAGLLLGRALGLLQLSRATMPAHAAA